MYCIYGILPPRATIPTETTTKKKKHTRTNALQNRSPKSLVLLCDDGPLQLHRSGQQVVLRRPGIAAQGDPLDGLAPGRLDFWPFGCILTNSLITVYIPGPSCRGVLAELPHTTYRLPDRAILGRVLVYKYILYTVYTQIFQVCNMSAFWLVLWMKGLNICRVGRPRCFSVGDRAVQKKSRPGPTTERK